MDLDDIRQQFPEPAHFPNFSSTAPNTHIPMFTGTTLVIQNGVYPYTDDLRTMESYRLNQTAFTLPTVCDSMGKRAAIPPRRRVQGLLDSWYAIYGFRIGFNTSQPLQTTRTNSARLHPNVVQEYLDHECHEGQVIDPLAITDHPEVHVSHFGVIPKKHQPNKWRLILDLTQTTAASTTASTNSSVRLN